MPPEVSDYSEFFSAKQRQATSTATAAMYGEQDPDQAAKALELGDATGMAPVAVLPQLDNVEREHRSMLSQELIKRNRFLQEYLNSDPMAAKLSHDDIGNLDAASQAFQKLNYKTPVEFAQRYLFTGLPEALEGFKEGFGGTDLIPTTRAFNRTAYGQTLGGAAVGFALQAAEAPATLGMKSISGFIRGVAELARTRIKEGADAVGLNGDLLSRDLAGMLEAEALGLTGRHGLPSPEQVQLIKGAINVAKPYLEAGKMPPTGVHPWIDSIYKTAAADDAKQLDEVVKTSNATQTLQRVRDIAANFYANNFAKLHGDSKVLIDANAIARLYGDARPKPDDGLLGWIDNLDQRLDASIGSGGYIEVPAWEYASKIDPEVHKELRDDLLLREHGFTVNEAKEVEESVKFEPTESAESDEKAIAQKPLEGEITPPPKKDLAGDAKVYQLMSGQLRPEYIDTPEFRALSEESDAMAAQIATAKFTNKDVSQQKAKYKELQKQMGAMLDQQYGTLEDLMKQRLKGEPRTLEGSLQTLRGSAGFEPLLAVGDRKLTLQKRPARIEGDVIKSDEFKILDENGQNVGWLEVIPYDGGKKIYVDNIGGMESKGYHPNSFGPALIRSIRQQLKQAYPQMEQIGGFRISGAREKAGTEREVWIKAEEGNLEAHQQFHNLLNAKWETVGDPTVEALFKTDEKGLAANSPLGQMVLAELKRVAPHIDADVVHGITYKGDQIFGGYLPNLKKIIVSLESPNVFATARHEAGHGFKDLGLFTDQEWSTLESAALTEGWLKKHKIGDRYPDLDSAGQVEEAIMHAYPDWVAGQKIPPEVVPLFQRIKDFLDGLLKKVADHLGLRADTWQDIFAKMESGEVGRREQPFEDTTEAMVTSRREEPKPQRPEGPPPINIRLPFAEGKAIGIRQSLLKQYMKLIEQRHKADLEHDFAQAYDKERRTQTKEWKEAAATMREQVVSELDEKPNVLLDRLMSERAGQLKLDPMSIHKDLREVLPPEYMRRTNSMSADDLAGYFGYPSGDALVEHLAELAQDRKASGLSHKDYVQKLTDDEVNRRMEAQYGFLEKNVLEEAKDRALSQNQIDILDTQIMILAEHAGLPMPFEKSAIMREIREAFNKTPAGTISSDVWLKAAGKAMKDVRDALMKDDFQEALKGEQRHFHATVQAKFAVQYEKQRKSLDKTAKRMGKITPENMPKSSVEPEFINHIQDQLYRVGYTGRRSWENVRQNISDSALGRTLEQFLQWHLADSSGYRDMPVGDFMLDPNFQKPIDKLTYEQFKQFKDTIDGLDTNGRALKKFETQGKAIELEAALDQAVAQVQTFDKIPMPPPGAPGHDPPFPKNLLALLTSMPRTFNRFDRGDRRGFFNSMMYDIFEGAAGAATMEREISKAWTEAIGKQDLTKKLAPPPMMKNWPYSHFTSGNVLSMIANAGNRSNWIKLAKGWGVDEPQQLWDWMVANSTREQWQSQQAMGDKVFNNIVAKADIVHERTHGSTVDKIPLTPFEVDFKDGLPPLQLQGWYHKLIPDTTWYAENNRIKGGFNDTNTRHIGTSDGYTRSRIENFFYPLDLSYNQLPGVLSQMAWDINMREPVMNAQKILKNPKFLNAVTAHYGKEYSKLMIPYLEDMAGQRALPTENMAKLEEWSEWLRANSMGTFIGFNPSTPIKHGVTALGMSLRAGGAGFFKEWTRQWFGLRPEAGNPWKKFAMDNSEILQLRERNFQETYGGALAGIRDESTFKEKMNRYGTAAVAASDKASATALWIDSYHKALEENPEAREAINLANMAVVRQHGTTLWPNKPELIRRSGWFHGWMTTFYGFMGERFQRMLDSAARIDDTWRLMEKKQFNEASKELPKIAADYAAYVINVGIGEELSSYMLSDEHKSGLYRLFNIMFGNMAKSVPYVRDMWDAMERGDIAGGVGMLPSVVSGEEAPFRDVGKMIQDAYHGRPVLNRQHAGKYVQDMMTAIGLGTGRLPKQLSYPVRFGIDVATGQQHPKSVSDYFHGLTRGKIQKESAR